MTHESPRMGRISFNRLSDSLQRRRICAEATRSGADDVADRLWDYLQKQRPSVPRFEVVLPPSGEVPVSSSSQTAGLPADIRQMDPLEAQSIGSAQSLDYAAQVTEPANTLFDVSVLPGITQPQDFILLLCDSVESRLNRDRCFSAQRS